MGVAIVVITILSFVHSILLSHKIFGPLVNIRHTIDKIAKGDFSRRIHLRKGDYLMDEAQLINAMMENLSGSIEELREDHEKMIQMMEKELHGADKDSEIGLKLHRIKPYADRCQNHLALFKLRS